MRIAITGGSGFIGQAAFRAAEQAGHEVWTFDRSDGHDIMEDLSYLRDADAVIHLAGVLGTAELFDTPEHAVHVNVLGTLRILKWCERHGARYVGITMPDVFPSVYTATKVGAKYLATAWHHTYGLPVSHVRAFNAFGPGQAYGPGHPQKIVPTFARCAWEDKPLPIWGDGTQTVDLIHADDIGRMLVDATRFGDDEVFDAGTRFSLTVNDVAKMVIERVGHGSLEYLPMRAGERATQLVAEGEGWSKLDWRPEFRIKDLHDTIDWYRP